MDSKYTKDHRPPLSDATREWLGERLTINAGESTGTRDPKHGRPVLCTGGSGPALRVAEYPDGSFTVEDVTRGKVLSVHDSYPEALIGLRVAWGAMQDQVKLSREVMAEILEEESNPSHVTSADALALDIEDGRAPCD